MKSITFTPAGFGEWRKLPHDVRQRIQARMKAFAESGAGDVRRLQGREGQRLRVGDWRVMFLIDGDVVVITAVGHRRDIYD